MIARGSRCLFLLATLAAGCSSGGGSGHSNGAPNAEDDAENTTEGTAVVLDVLANDTDPEADAIAIVGFTDGASGVTSLSASGALTYLPNAGFTGTDTFTYEISDGRETSSATVTMTVDPAADLEEAAEPNDDDQPADGLAGTFTLPAMGADAVVFHGCIEPYRDVFIDGDDDPDFDAWEISTTEPSVIDVSADGSGGLSAGFFVQASDPFLSTAGWIRFGLAIEDDSVSRQIYLPSAGTYRLFMADTRSLTLGVAAGSPGACYYASVSRAAEPAPIAGSVGAPFVVPAGKVPTFVDIVPASNGQAFDIDHTITGDSLSVLSSVLALVNGTAGAYDTATLTVGTLDTSDSLRLVVEPVFDMTLSPREVTLDVSIVP